MEKEKHVVVVYPHPDDESFGAAGTITKFRNEGVPVTYLCGTLGEMGRNMGNPPFANRETMPLIREKELAEACRLLDIEYKLLGYRDKTLEFEDIREVANHIKEIIEDINPSLVITHYPPYAVHPDHNALGAATIEAVQMMEPDKRPKLWAQAISKSFETFLGEPDIIHDVTEQFDKKVEAIFAHKSQASGLIETFSGKTPEAIEQKTVFEKRMSLEQFYIWDFDNPSTVKNS